MNEERREKRKHAEPINSYAGIPLTGLGKVKDKHKNATAIITAAGPSLTEFDHTKIVMGSQIIIAVAGAIRYWYESGISPHYWVVSDEPIVNEYYEFVPSETVIIAFQQAVRPLVYHKPKITQDIHTAQTMTPAREYDNPYQFFSRGTVLIAALLAAKYMGIVKAYVFGFDCYRTKEKYHFDGRVHPDRSENTFNNNERIEGDRWITDKLKRMITMSEKASKAGLFDGMDVTVINRLSKQTAFKRVIDLADFYKEWNGTYSSD